MFTFKYSNVKRKKRNKLLVHTTAWMDLKGGVLMQKSISKISYTM